MMMRALALTALITLTACDEATRAVDDAARDRLDHVEADRRPVLTLHFDPARAAEALN